MKLKQVLPTNSSSSSTSSRRVGTRTVDLLMQVCFIRYQSSTDDLQTVVCVRDPVPVARKSGWCLFEAWKQSQPTLRSMNKYGIAIEHVVADRAEQSPLERHIKEHILQQHQRLSQAELPPGGVASLGNKQWVVSNPCACHDGHNSLKWALSTYMSDKESVRAVFATTRSLRASYVVLAQHLGSWLLSVLRFDVCPYSPTVLHQLWTLLGLESSLVDTLVELGVHVKDGQVMVSLSCQGDPSLMENLSGVMLSLLSMKQVTESRWLMIGCSMRSLTACTLLGLDGLLEHTMADPSVSLYHLSGAKRFVGQARVFAMMAGLCSFVGDSFVADVLEDNRVPRRVDELESGLRSEMDFVMSLSHEVYSLVGSVCNFTGARLRSEVVAACTVSYSYIYERTILPAKNLPWSLCSGNIQQNLSDLKDYPEPAEPRRLPLDYYCLRTTSWEH